MKKQSKPSAALKSGKPVKSISEKKGSEQQRPKPFPIVAFGASAGGLKAFTSVLTHLEPDLGMAYVLIMHLSPNHKSSLGDIVQSRTTMPVHTVVDGMALKMNNIFVIPPNTFMSVVDGHLKLAPRSIATRGNFAIDYFMTGLAAIYKNNAIGVILSGTARDGTLGLKAIKSEGGITFAQDESAEFDGMPQSAVDSGYVDCQLSAAGIATELERLIKTPYTNLPSDKMDVVSTNEINSQTDDLKKTLTLVKNRSGVDFFQHYKQASICRRLMRRMALNEFEKLSDYAVALRSNPKEVDALFDDFLINVTNFFRDPAFYKTLSEVILPAIMKDRKPNEPIRIWSAGCATGEEAYSIAICVTEYLTKNKLSAPIQVFASDLDVRAIEKARLGIYPMSALHGVSAKYLELYFRKTDSQYQVVKSIRENCVFSHHNLLKDPPFSRISLVSCQNVLIYLENNPQKKILQTFHYALKPGGYLFLAKSETTGSSAEFFEPLDKKIRYYSRKAATASPIFPLQMSGSTGDAPPGRIDHSAEADTEKDMEKLMLSRFVYPSVVVSKNLTITQFFGETSAWLEPSAGRASLNVLKMIRDDLVIDLRTLLEQARKTEQPAIKENIRIDSKKTAVELTLEVVPRKTPAGMCFLIVFKEKAETVVPPGDRLKSTPGSKDRTIVKLEAEIVKSLEVIRTTTEEYETTYEELQANNEEILSANEELQSVNEELETSKEELQSSNEELTTINEELNKRNLELKESQEYTDAILETMHGPLLVLSSNLQIRGANKSFYDTFKLLPEKTEGNFLYDLGDGNWDIPALREHLKEVRPGASMFKSFELRYFFAGVGERDLTINVYRMAKGDSSKEALILLAFDDFTRRYNAEASLFKTQEELKLSLIGDSIGTWWWDMKADKMKWSRENELLNELPEGTFGGDYEDWERLIHPEDLIGVKESIARSIARSHGHHRVEFEYRIALPDKTLRWILSRGQIYFDADHNAERMVGVSMDNTERRLNAEHLEALVESRTIELLLANSALVKANQQLEQFVFISSHDLQEPLRKIQTFSNLLAGGESDLNPFSRKYLAKINDSASRMTSLLRDLHGFSTLKDDPGNFVRVDLNDVARHVLKDFEVKIGQKDAIINLSPLPEVQAEPGQMHQLLFQLMGNALKFNKAVPLIDMYGEAVTDETYDEYPDLEREASYVSFVIKDNGIGFNPKYASKLFVLFQQMKEMDTTGTGIGLAMCKKIVQNHGGFIFAKGAVNQGATFTVFLRTGTRVSI